MTDIKVGDKVRCTVDCVIGLFKIGDEFIVDSIYYYTEIRRSNKCGDYMSPSEVELVKKEEKGLLETATNKLITKHSSYSITIHGQSTVLSEEVAKQAYLELKEYFDE